MYALDGLYPSVKRSKIIDILEPISDNSRKTLFGDSVESLLDEEKRKP